MTLTAANRVDAPRHDRRKNNVWTRAAWQQERDKAGVAKGAARVSGGDALDRFHKLRAEGLAGVPDAAYKLLVVLDNYVKAIKPKHADFAARVERQLIGYTKQDARDVRLLMAGARTYSRSPSAAMLEMRVTGAKFVQWEQGGKVRPFVPSNKADLLNALTKLLDDYAKGV